MKSGNGFFQYRIMLRPDEVKDFVRAASGCDFDIDIAYNSYVVDAKSILGVLGLDLNRVLTVWCHGYSEKFDSYLRQFSLAG
ncbi:MAG TPA: HPr family phosphocarrier protein [Candidatus Eisenbergiella merdipullorum]|uniref:HPr family phosphocarrier protein n=1 Tax=Candidatus Eisenbergiella merdipullorum TaxID=2838553 RepID=A0A9D2I550_9FIRM|nr:HPr family phosphocarrier protein [Candidatus Eisenbergiella merdipullorum]